MEADSQLIKEGDYIIVKRQNYTKIHKITKAKCSVMLGKDEIDLTAVIGQRYWTTYKLERKGTSRAYTLKKCKKEISFTGKCHEQQSLSAIFFIHISLSFHVINDFR